jgi:matrix metalloproteinase-28 (epilysin)
VESCRCSAVVIAVCTGETWKKYDLSYTVETYPELPRSAVDEEINCAVAIWAAASTNLSFHQVPNREDADIRITFNDGDHNDAMPFDGRGMVVAHAFRPPVGSIHFDSAEQWTIRCSEGTNTPLM